MKTPEELSDDELVAEVIKIYALPEKGKPKAPLTSRARVDLEQSLRIAELIGQRKKQCIS